MSQKLQSIRWAAFTFAMPMACPAIAAEPDVSVGTQYDSTHVYVAPGDMNTFIKSFTATFGGQASPAFCATRAVAMACGVELEPAPPITGTRPDKTGQISVCL
jgi:hypothetical protein